MKTVALIQSRKHVAHVDDERGDGGSILITLSAGFDFADDPGCGVKGFDNLKDAEAGTRASDVQPSKPYTRSVPSPVSTDGIQIDSCKGCP